MKRIVSAALLLMMLLAFTACDKAETSQSVSSSPTQTQQAATATATSATGITQAPTATVTPTLEITKKPIVTNKPNSGTATRLPNWQSATIPPEMTKADYDFGITYIIDDFYGIYDPGIVDDYVKMWANNDGDPAELEAAVQAIQNMDFTLV